MFRVEMHYPDGSIEEDDEVFESEDDAKARGLQMCSDYSTGGEVLNLSNPGDYPLDDEEADFEVIEVDA